MRNWACMYPSVAIFPALPLAITQCTVPATWVKFEIVSGKWKTSVREIVRKGKSERIKCNPLMEDNYKNNVFSYSIGQTEQPTTITTGGTFPLASPLNLTRSLLRRSPLSYVSSFFFSPRSTTASQERESAMMSLGCLPASCPSSLTSKMEKNKY